MLLAPLSTKEIFGLRRSADVDGTTPTPIPVPTRTCSPASLSVTW
ncbi:unnamed protein product [Trichobilharzia regenti]|nr:unnamed protein product [Trichobilharzia regenti]